jgi:multiple sugar transport system ATP-binding protein
MRAGRLEQAGAPLDLYDRPINAFVAGFIGSPAMNLLPGMATGPMVDLGQGLNLPLDQSASGGVLYGIRPEHLDQVPTGTPSAITATATVVESTGTAMFVATKAGNTEIHALFSDRPAIKRGDVIGLKPRAGLSHLFDAKTQIRIG